MPKTRWSATPPVICRPVAREMERRIWLRLESSARTSMRPSLKVTLAWCGLVEVSEDGSDVAAMGAGSVFAAGMEVGGVGGSVEGAGGGAL